MSDEGTDGPEPVEERYEDLRNGDGDTIVYDRQQPTAWVQSSFVIDLSDHDRDQAPRYSETSDGSL